MSVIGSPPGGKIARFRIGRVAFDDCGTFWFVETSIMSMNVPFSK